MSVYEIYVEKKPQYADEAAAVAADLRMGLQLEKIEKVRLVNRYFAEGIEAQDFEAAKNTIFSEPPVDISYDSLPSFGDARVFAVEYLPGQFDQRADSCAQCISLATGKERPIIQSAKVYAVYGAVSDADFARVKSWLINPVESRQASLEKPATLLQKYPEPKDVETLNGFIKLNDTELEELRQKLNLAMDLSDIQFCQTYFLDKEKRDPTITEIRVLDTYWSDHCRHTTFLTELVNIDIEDETVNESYKRYLNLRASLSLGTRDEGRGTRESGSKTILDNNTNNIANKNPLSPVPCPQSPIPITLMDIATIGAKALKKRGLLPDLDESDEINACSVKIKVDIENNNEDWLLMFKNETHNHPTEIESFGGAATCLGGAIRDPLSGRSFVYQAMRVTGAGDPLQSETLPGKLPQRKICRTAAAGYSSYGNQIGLATGLVHEIYHPGYVAKRMEIGAVIGAAPEGNVVRETPTPGDVVILLGGRTGRDGIGGATGSSKSHTASSLETCGADVQKGNAPEERKIQRLFRNPQATRLIKRCNDFGAGGVSVSVGELADGITIDLDKVPKKYEGLDGTELAISESQERMSIVVAKDDVEKFFSLAASENLEATVIAQITEEKRLVMKWRGGSVVDLCREFLNSNGAKRSASVKIGVTGSGEREEGSGFCPKSNLDITNQRLQTTTSSLYPLPSSLSAEELETLISSLNICSQKGLVDRFDSSIGAATVIAPFGGKYQLTPAQVMAAKVPVLYGETKTVSLMSWGFDPEISSASPYHGAVFAVVHSLAKIIAAGGSRKKCWLSFQEYFERLRDDPVRWGKPFAALLGALDAQLGLEIAAIGGKDSMSGSFENIDVPPTLVSFAVSVTKIDNVVTPEFKKAGSFVYLLKGPETGLDFNSLRNFFDEVEKLIKQKKILSAWALGSGGTAEAIPKMCFGNRIGFCAKKELETGNGFCGFVVETDEEVGSSNEQLAIELLGRTTESYILKTPSIERFMFKIQLAWEKTLEPVYPYLGVTKNGGTHCVRGQDIVISNRELEQQSLVPRPSSLHS